LIQVDKFIVWNFS